MAGSVREHPILEHPKVYDLIQRLGRWHVTARRLQAVMADASGKVVLDVGAGTGNLAPLLPADAEYMAIDIDAARIRSLERKCPGARCMVRSALDTGLEDDAADWSVCNGLAHHLEDEDVPRLIAELARVTRERLVFVEPLWPGKHLINGVLWRYDRGSHPRPESTLLSALRAHFAIDSVERFWPSQELMLCVARPIKQHDAPTATAGASDDAPAEQDRSVAA
jgi:SAM-dependent methyltransferase